MLGEDGDKGKKKILKTVKKSVLASQEGSTDDEDNIFEGAAKITTMKVARNAQIYRRQIPKMAAPESDSDMSSDEERTMQKLFRIKPAQAQPVRTTRSTNKTELGGNQNSLLKSNNMASNVSKPSVLPTSVKTKVTSGTKPPAASTPLRTYTNTRLQRKQPLTSLKEATKPATPTPAMRKPETRKVEVRKPETRKVAVHKPETRKVEVHKPEIRKVEMKKPSVPKTFSQQIKYVKEEEGLMDDDEDYDMDEELEESDEELSRLRRKATTQQLMKPEQMDEDMLSEEESEPSEASFYDEMPSSESEDIEEWFALDIRAERAGDYIPLLGHKANELLAEEKKRVVKKLSVLRENIQSLSEKSKEQTEQIEAARRSLAELDTIITHT